MSDLIKRDDAVKAYKECLETSECGTMLNDEAFYELLLNIPSVDVADRPKGRRICHCGECKHYIFGGCSKLHLTGINPTDGCTWGERKDK